jgi:hypothetical protein
MAIVAGAQSKSASASRRDDSEAVDAFLDHLATERKLSASSVNHHRTIVNGIFNFAVKRGRFDRGATILMTLGVPDPIVRKVTGHRSRELERYQHLTPELRALTVNLIATELFRGKRTRKERENGTPTGTVRGRRASQKIGERQHTGTKRDVGGVDGTRTRGLRRDRPAF